MIRPLTGTLSPMGAARNAPFSPADLANLTFWLNADDVSGADGDSVTTWTDRIAGHQFTQAVGTRRAVLKKAIQGGRAALRFDGSDDRYDVPSGLAGLTRNVPAFTLYQVIRDSGGATRRTFAVRGGTAGTTRFALARSFSNQYRMSGIRLDAETYVDVNQGTSTTGWHYECARMDWSARTQELYSDGTRVLYNTTFQTAGNTSDTDSLSGFLGAQTDATTTWVGDIACMLAYKALHTDAERLLVSNYLKDYYGL